MPQINMKRAVLLSAPVVLLVGLSIAWSAPRPSRADDARKLLDQRRDVLQHVVGLQREAYKRGEARFDSVFLAEKELLEAELELAERPAERIEIYARLVKTMQDMEDMSHQLYEAGQGSHADHLRSKAARLKAQADLIRQRDRSDK